MVNIKSSSLRGKLENLHKSSPTAALLKENIALYDEYNFFFFFSWDCVDVIMQS